MQSPINRTAIPGRGLVTVEPNAAVTPAALESPVTLPGAQVNPAISAARKALVEKLKIAESDIKVIGVDEVQWPDGCLGVKQPGVMCTQAIVDGFSVALEANGTRYEYHTNTSGSQVILASPRD